MKVKELIDLLQGCDPELQVYNYCDHGQTPEKSSAPQVIYVESLDHTLWDGYASSEGEAEEYGHDKKAVIL